MLSPCKTWWAMTGSNCRPSRCKREVSPLKWRISLRVFSDFARFLPYLRKFPQVITPHFAESRDVNQLTIG